MVMKTIALGQGLDRRRYTILESAVDGSIDNPRTAPTLQIGPPRGARGHLSVAIHEGMHGEFPWMSEENVERAEDAIARLLWGLGYRLPKE